MEVRSAVRVRLDRSDRRPSTNLVAKDLRSFGRVPGGTLLNRPKPDLALLNCEIDPSLENFQTACGHVGGEGRWELMPRLEALVAKQPKGAWLGGGVRGKWDAVLAPLRKAEKAYHAERDACFKAQEGT